MRPSRTSSSKRERFVPPEEDEVTGAQVPKLRGMKNLIQDELRFTDLLDGSSMPTIGAAPTPPAKSDGNMSAQTDSIISLPPLLDDRPSRWNNLRSGVPPRLQRVRGGSLGGRDISKMLENRQRSRPPAPIPVSTGDSSIVASKGEDDVRISISPLTTDMSSSGPAHQRHKRRASRMKSDDFTEEESDRSTSRNANNRLTNYGSVGGLGYAGGVGPSGGVGTLYNPSPSSGGYLPREEDEWSTGASSHNGSVSRRRRRARRRRRQEFEEHQWDWRFPGNEDALMPSMAWIYLPLIGWLVFATAFLVNHFELLVRDYVVNPVHHYATIRWGQSFGLIILCSVRAAIAFLSFVMVYNFAPLYGPGSGIPEMKCVLTGVFMPNALSGTTLASKMAGLSLISASGISVGKMGPFMHMGVMVANLVSQIPMFKTLGENPLFKLQAFSAAMAAGVGATFGAPLGGVMLSIELMSAYYYVHWLPMAMFCSIMGYYLLCLFVETDSHVYFNPDVVISITGHAAWYVVVYSILGLLCGLGGFFLIRFTVLMKKALGWMFSSNQPEKMALFLTSFVVLHSIVARSVGGILDVPQKSGVDKLFGSESSNEYEWLNSSLQLWQNSIGNSFALLIVMWVKFALTGVSLVLPIPAGTFMPIFELGAFLGRSYGEFIRSIPMFSWVDPRATAIVGAASFTTGTLHVTSIALVMLELTREAVNVLPITIAVVCSYALSKSLSSDLFSELIKLRGLPYILGLREQYPSETRQFHKHVSAIVAKSFMEKKFPFVTPRSTVQDVRRALTEPWQVIAFLNDEKEKKLFGVIKRRDMEGVMDSLEAVGSNRGGSDVVSAASTPIEFLRKFDPNIGDRLVDMGVMQVSVHTPFWKVITYFRMLSMNVMYAMTTNGSVAGMITKPLLIARCLLIEKEAKSKRLQQREQAHKDRKEEENARVKYNASQRLTRSTALKMSSQNLIGMDNGSSGRRSRQSSMTLP